jgi:hypothetical protein
MVVSRSALFAYPTPETIFLFRTLCVQVLLKIVVNALPVYSSAPALVCVVAVAKIVKNTRVENFLS